MRSMLIPGILGVIMVGGVAAYAIEPGQDDPDLTVVLPNANNLFEGGSVTREGFRAGTISDIKVKDGLAYVGIDLDDKFGRLRDGATAQVEWKAALGERQVRINDGSAKNPELKPGAVLTGAAAEPVELDSVLSSLDAPTRKKLNVLIRELSGALDNREADVNQTLKTAGPALDALGTVLTEARSDGEAIKQIVTQLDATMNILAKRDSSLKAVVSNLSTMTSAVVKQDKAFGQTLDRLPNTLAETDRTLKRVPSSVDAAVPLLKDLDPATERLTKVSGDLRPLLVDLRPAVADLRPTLGSLSELLRYTPGLMRAGKVTFPQINNAANSALPAVDFLRPYTPELAGWATNWGSAAGNYDANGHYNRFLIQTGMEAPIGSTSAPGPGVTQNLTPAPGAPVDQPWTDAYGSEMR